MATASASAASGVEALEAGSSVLTIIATWFFSRMPDADHRLLDQIGGVFGNRKVFQRERGAERDPARLSKFQCRLGIAVDECLLDRRLVWRDSARRARSARNGSTRACRPGRSPRRFGSSRRRESSGASPATSIRPQPVLRRPGSTPRMRIAPLFMQCLLYEIAADATCVQSCISRQAPLAPASPVR